MPTEVIQRDDKFGISNTYNPYTNSMSLANVANQRFRIPLTQSYANASVVVVSTGLVPRIENVLNGDIVFNLYEDDNQTLIQQFIPKVVDVGSGQYPARNEINWFDLIGMQGDFMVHSDWCGKILEISGKIETCSITAEDINSINKNIKDNYNDLLDRLQHMQIEIVQYPQVTVSRQKNQGKFSLNFDVDWAVGSLVVSVFASVSGAAYVTASASASAYNAYCYRKRDNEASQSVNPLWFCYGPARVTASAYADSAYAYAAARISSGGSCNKTIYIEQTRNCFSEFNASGVDGAAGAAVSAAVTASASAYGCGFKFK